MPVLPVGQHPYKAVKEFSCFFNDHASGKYDPVFTAHPLHPLYCFPIHFFCMLAGIHTKPGTEHFRQHNDLCFFLNGCNFLLKQAQVRRFLFPEKVGLYGTDGEG